MRFGLVIIEVYMYVNSMEYFYTRNLWSKGILDSLKSM